MSGTWREDGRGACMARRDARVLETFAGSRRQQPARYGGIIDLGRDDQRHAREADHYQPADDHERRIRASYEKLAGRIDYTDGLLDLNIRLDQAPKITLLGQEQCRRRIRSDRARKLMNVLDLSSAIDLGPIEGSPISCAMSPAS